MTDTPTKVKIDAKSFSDVKFTNDGLNLVISWGEGKDDSTEIKGYFENKGTDDNPKYKMKEEFRKQIFEIAGKEYNLVWDNSNVEKFGNVGMYNFVEGTSAQDGTKEKPLTGVDKIKNWIQGREGDDFLNAVTKGDMVAGDQGNDTITSTVGEVELYGSIGNDIISATGGDSFVAGGEGNDTITVGGGNNEIALINTDGLATARKIGEDTVIGATSSDTLEFSFGKAGETVYGYNFNELSFNKENNDLVISAKDGDDLNKAIIKDYYTAKDRVDNVLAYDSENNTLAEFSIVDDAVVNAVSTAKDETFDLGTGKNEIKFSGYTGQDTVNLKGTNDDQLTLDFGEANVSKEIKGNDLVLSTESNYRYIVTADVSGVGDKTPELDGHPVSAKTLTFGMGMADVIGSANSTIKKGDFIFTSSVIYEATLEGQSDDAEGVTIMLDKAAFIEGKTKIGGLTLSNIKVLQIAGTSKTDDATPVVIKDITEDYQKAVKALKDDTDTARNYSDYNKELFATALGWEGYTRGTVESTVTIKDFAKDETVHKVLLGEYDLAEDVNYYVKMGKDKEGKALTSYTGTKLNENILSTENNETFAMGTGKDEITFSRYFGNDTVKVSAGETLNLKFDDSNLSYEAKGNDLEISTESKIRYIITAKVDPVGNATKPTLDGHEFPESALTDGRIKFSMSMASSIGTTDSEIKVGDWVFSSDVIYDGTYSKPEQGVLIMLGYASLKDAFDADKGSFVFDGAKFSDLKVLEVAASTFDEEATAPVVQDITEQYKAEVLNCKSQAEYSALNAKYFAEGWGQRTIEFGGENYSVGEEGQTQKTVTSTVTIKDFDKAVMNADITINGKDIYDDTTHKYLVPDIGDLFTLNETDVKKGKITTKGATNNTIDVSDYIAGNGKGVKITTGTGDDVITGSLFNDTVKSKNGDNLVVEKGGNNKITLGKGNDEVYVEDYSSNTINVGAGDNYVDLDSYGTNKVTAGAGDDVITVSSGVNTIKAGNGENVVAIGGTYDPDNAFTPDTDEAKYAINKVTTGKHADIVYANGGINTINVGAGDDYVELLEGYNNVTLGKGSDEIYIAGGVNTVKGTAGANSYYIKGGDNIITGGSGVDTFIFANDAATTEDYDTFIVNGGKGNDIYDLREADYNDDIIITDKKGKNTVKIASTASGTGKTRTYTKDTILFDVVLGKKVSKSKISSTLIFDKDGKLDTLNDRVSYTGTIKNVVVTNTKEDDSTVDTTYTLDIKQVGMQVAAWMDSQGLKKGASAFDILENGTETQKTALLGIYQGKGYTPSAAGSTHVNGVDIYGTIA